MSRKRTRIIQLQPWQLEVGDQFMIAGALAEIKGISDTSIPNQWIKIIYSYTFDHLNEMKLYHAYPIMDIYVTQKDRRYLH